jgi:hypothetical protein
MKKHSQIALPAASLILFACVAFSNGKAQDNKPSPAPSPSSEQKCEQIINRAIEVLGGSNYLNVRTVTGRGYYTQYRDGMSQLPAKFVDYLVYPDKERTEFTGGGTHVIQANAGEGGWIFDGA